MKRLLALLAPITGFTFMLCTLPALVWAGGTVNLR